MAAKETVNISKTVQVKGYEKSILVNGKSIYLQTEVTDDMWFNFLEFISGFNMKVYNQGVEDSRATMREALGL